MQITTPTGTYKWIGDKFGVMNITDDFTMHIREDWTIQLWERERYGYPTYHTPEQLVKLGYMELVEETPLVIKTDWECRWDANWPVQSKSSWEETKHTPAYSFTEGTNVSVWLTWKIYGSKIVEETNLEDKAWDEIHWVEEKIEYVPQDDTVLDPYKQCILLTKAVNLLISFHNK